ncbi:MAG: hypothetical protein LAQ69_37485 [Acidobacteriia bacterium]|nr:hypothetical protein [Terriglobia bacterium]
MPNVPRAWVNEELIAEGLRRAERALAPDVVRIRYSFEDDWTATRGRHPRQAPNSIACVTWNGSPIRSIWQLLRQTADYDNSTTWTRTQADALGERVDAAFKSWHAIREEPAAQAYLISLLGNPKGV